MEKKFDKKLKKKWVKALRSKKYEQGVGRLKRLAPQGADHPPKEAFCCLGVLCDVIDPRGWREEQEEYESLKPYYQHVDSLGRKNGGLGRARGSVPHSLKEKIGLTTDVESLLIMMNDRFPQTSFEEIATYIEENL